MANKRAPLNTNEVWVPPQETLKDCMGQPWRLTATGDPMNLRAVLLRAVRLCPVRNGGDAERTYNLVQAIQAEDHGMIKFTKTDFDWMIAHFKEMGHQVWSPPDSFWLVKHLGEIVILAQPSSEEAE
jgi:hypothetical protein